MPAVQIPSQIPKFDVMANASNTVIMTCRMPAWFAIGPLKR